MYNIVYVFVEYLVKGFKNVYVFVVLYLGILGGFIIGIEIFIIVMFVKYIIEILNLFGLLLFLMVAVVVFGGGFVFGILLLKF